MRLPFSEPTSPRYLYIDQSSNQVHLLVPVVGGQEISTDNTCKSTASLDEFFKQGAALRELSAYQSALEFDLQLLDSGHPLKAPKQQRLNQIKEYIKAINTMKGGYSKAVTELMQVTSNLYSIQLRPRDQDPHSLVVNPLFSMNRGNDNTGTPLSALYNAMYAAYPNAKIAPLDPQAQLSKAVLAALPQQSINFEGIRRALTEHCHHLFGLTIDFTKAKDGSAVSKASIDTLMGFTPGNPATTQDYIDALLGTCALNLFETISTPPFYKVQDNPDKTDKTEKLSILTQFFLAQVNLYCTANKLNSSNFGVVLDKSSSLSNALAGIVSSSLEAGAPVEERLCTFFNEHTTDFGLSRPLNLEDIDSIKQKFNRTYATVTGTAENPHMDDFMILDTSQTTGSFEFVTHQGSICIDFSKLVPDNPDFERVRNACKALPREIPHKNEWLKGDMELDIEALISKIQDDEQYDKLPLKIRLACQQSPAFQCRTFLHNVAKGKQEAALLLTQEPSAQALLRAEGTFTDYSGRTFTCTAYEYAYWAKDTYMCRMLEEKMDNDTKAHLLERIEAMEQINETTSKPVGLTYSQNNKEYQSAHYDFSPLKTALKHYVDEYNKKPIKSDADWAILDQIWIKEVGGAQRDVPAHVAHEYCHPDRSFYNASSSDKLPTFKDTKLPRELSFYNWDSRQDERWFPLPASSTSGLGFNFAIIRGARAGGCAAAGRDDRLIWRPLAALMK